MKKLLVYYAIATATVIIVVAATSILTKEMGNNAQATMAATIVALMGGCLALVAFLASVEGATAVAIVTAAGLTTAITAGINMVVFAVLIVFSATAAVAGIVITTKKDKNINYSETTATVIAFLLNFTIIYYLPKFL